MPSKNEDLYLQGGNGNLNGNAARMPSGNSTLRRCKSMGAGISKIGEELASSQSTCSSSETIDGQRLRSCIPAEEMPAPDTVKNVRTVFEKMLQEKRKLCRKDSSDLPNGDLGLIGDKESYEHSNGSNLVTNTLKKCLSSIKSNPSSKILRSESCRVENDMGTLQRRHGKPVLLHDNNGNSPLGTFSEKLKSASPTFMKQMIDRKLSEPIQSTKMKNGYRPREDSLTEEELSLLCGLPDNESKYVSPDVMQRIRSCGTTTTYFGGQIVAKTVKNRKLAVSRRHTLDYQEYYDNINSSPYNYTPVCLTPTDVFSGNGLRFRNNQDNNSTSGNSGRSSNSGSPNNNFYNGDIAAKGLSNVTFGTLTKSVSIDTFSPSTNNHNQQTSRVDYKPSFHLPLESIYNTAAIMKADTAPRIISVLPKSPQSNSPTKSGSPAGSIIEGRNSPEGCESQDDNNCHSRSEWIRVDNDNPHILLPHNLAKDTKPNLIHSKSNGEKQQDGNNNSIVTHSVNSPEIPNGHTNGIDNKKFSQITEGAWF